MASKVLEIEQLLKEGKIEAKSPKAFGVDGNGDVLSELLRSTIYSSVISTLCQEVMSNARDGSRESVRTGKNKKEPAIEVTLPSKIKPYLVVKDYGVGMSKQTIYDIFRRLGVSTKKGDDGQTGGFGIGSKIPWAYSSSFLMICCYDGVKTTYYCHTNKSRAGELVVLKEEATKEENGVEVQVPIIDSGDFAKFIRAVYRCAYFWDVRPIIKGVVEDEIPDWYKNKEPNLKGNNWELFDNRLSNIVDQNHKIYIAVDKILYPVDGKFINANENNEFIQKLNRAVRANYFCVLHIKPKSGVEVTATRETISEVSIEHINSMCKSVLEDVSREVEKQVSNAKTVKSFWEKNKSLTGGFTGVKTSIKLFGNTFIYEAGRIYSPIFDNYIIFERSKPFHQKVIEKVEVTSIDFDIPVFLNDEAVKMSTVKVQEAIDKTTKKKILVICAKEKSILTQMKELEKVCEGYVNFSSLNAKEEEKEKRDKATIVYYEVHGFDRIVSRERKVTDFEADGKFLLIEYSQRDAILHGKSGLGNFQQLKQTLSLLGIKDVYLTAQDGYKKLSKLDNAISEADFIETLEVEVKKKLDVVKNILPFYYKRELGDMAKRYQNLLRLETKDEDLKRIRDSLALIESNFTVYERSQFQMNTFMKVMFEKSGFAEENVIVTKLLLSLLPEKDLKFIESLNDIMDEKRRKYPLVSDYQGTSFNGGEDVTPQFVEYINLVYSSN